MRRNTVMVLFALLFTAGICSSAFAADQVWSDLEKTLKRADSALESGQGGRRAAIMQYERTIRSAFHKARMSYERQRRGGDSRTVERKISALVAKEQQYRAKMTAMRSGGGGMDHSYGVDISETLVDGIRVGGDHGDDDLPTEPIDHSYGDQIMTYTNAPGGPGGSTTIGDVITEVDKDRPSAPLGRHNADGEEIPPVDLEFSGSGSDEDYMPDVSLQAVTNYGIDTVTNILGPGITPGGGIDGGSGSGGFPVGTDGSD